MWKGKGPPMQPPPPFRAANSCDLYTTFVYYFSWLSITQSGWELLGVRGSFALLQALHIQACGLYGVWILSVVQSTLFCTMYMEYSPTNLILLMVTWAPQGDVGDIVCVVMKFNVGKLSVFLPHLNSLKIYMLCLFHPKGSFPNMHKRIAKKNAD